MPFGYAINAALGNVAGFRAPGLYRADKARSLTSVDDFFNQNDACAVARIESVAIYNAPTIAIVFVSVAAVIAAVVITVPAIISMIITEGD